MSSILAIDPGYDRCGVAIIENGTVVFSDCVTTRKNDRHEVRLATLYETLEGVVKTWHPSAVALETLFFSVNKKTAIKVAEARGIILLLAGKQRVPLIELSPQEVKIAMTGIGNASKAQVQKMVALTLRLDLSSVIDDEADAIALGIAAEKKLHVDNLSKALAKKK